MDSPLFFEKEVPTIASEVSCLPSLLERALHYARQGLCRESVIFLRLLRERLSSEQSTLISALDTYIMTCNNYYLAQYELQQASKRFAEADGAQQAQIDALEHLLPLLKEGGQTFASTPPVQAQKPILAAATPQNLLHSPPSSLLPTATLDKSELPGLSITCFGRFTVKRLQQAITLCTNRSGQTIFRYLIAQPHHSATIDKLIQALWPEEEMDTALHKLRIAASALRRSLNEGYDCAAGGYVLCKNGVYQLNPDIALQSDVAEFLTLYHTGLKAERDKAVPCYEQACQLYTGPFLSEDLYADWSFFQREQLCQTYLSMCSSLASYYLDTYRYPHAIQWATTMLKENKCDEGAHQQLMRAYAAEGRRTEALRQYQRCQQVLDEELGISPMPETIELSQMIQDGTFSAS
jgi:DNA-binding SARP family transcriptional activator